MRQPPILIEEPIDYERLAEAYRDAKWKFHDGYPSPARLEILLHQGQTDLATRQDPRACFGTGGLLLEWKDGKISISIHAKLAEHYFKKLA